MSAPEREWMLSLPLALRYRLAYDGSLTTALPGTLVRTVLACLRRRARDQSLLEKEIQWWML
jgi:hypothetical protein